MRSLPGIECRRVGFRRGGHGGLSCGIRRCAACRPRINSIWPMGWPVALAITSGEAPWSARVQIAA